MISSQLPTDIHLEKIQQAIGNGQVVQMHYFSPGSGAFTERAIEPLGTVYYGKAWHVIAYCRLRQDYRDFRLDRMSKLSVTSKTSAPRDRRLLESYLERQSQATDARLVKVRFDPSATSLAPAHYYSFGLVKEEIQEEYVERWFMVAQEETFCQWMRQYGDMIAVISPPGFC